MKRNKKFLLTVISVILLVVLVTAFVGCKNNTTATPSEEDTSELFTNGSFTGATGESYPLTPSSWTGAPGSTSSSDSYKTPTGSDNLIAGVISTEDKTYRSNSKTYGNAANPGKKGEDDNILMIYNKVSTVYKYTSSSVTLNKSSYYKLSVWVKTIGINKSASDYNEGKSGAYIYVNGAAYAAFEAIDTEGAWKEYSVYIETSDISSQTITVVLSLGNGSKMENSMTQGWAFFDSVTLTDLTDVEEGEEAWTASDFNKIEESATVSKYTMKLADSDFDYITSPSSPYNMSKYTKVKGTGNGDDAPSASDYITAGIIKTSETTSVVNSSDNSDLNVTTHTGADGRIYYQQNKKATAYGIRSSVATRFMGGEQYYKLGFWVRTNIADAEKGMTIKLTDGTTDPTVYYSIENINTGNEWKLIELYVESNQFRYQDVYLEFWLGEGGADDTETHVQGIFFVDDLSLTSVTAEDYNNAKESETVYKHSFATTLSEDSLLNLADFGEANGEDAISGRSTYGVVDSANWESGAFKDIENPGAPTSVTSSVLVINNYLPSVYTLSTVYEKDDNVVNGSIELNPNSYYAFSFWIKTKDIDKATGINVSLISYDKKKKYDESKTTLATFSSLNTENLTDYKSANNEDYTEIRFFVQTGTETEYVGFDISLGSGTANDSSSHATGYAFISTATVEKVSASDYSSASTSTVLKTYSFVASSGSAEVSSNGYFKLTDVKATQELYGDDVYSESGSLDGALGVPTGWTAYNTDMLKNGKATAGVLNINNDAQKAATGFSVNAETFYDTLGIEGINATDYPYVLAIRSSEGYYGYKSKTLSLSSDSYYVVSVWAKMEADSVMAVTLDTTTKSANYTVNPIRSTDVGTGWQQYTFLVKTSATSLSATLGLYVGSEDGSTAGETKTAYFTMASYTSVSENAYNALLDAATKAETLEKTVFERTFNTDSFDSYTESDSTAFTPSNWTGAKMSDDASTDAADLTAGVFNAKEGDWTLLDLDPDDSEDEKIVNAIYNNTDTNYVGDNVLVIYNKNANGYKYTSSSLSLKGDTYYKISVWVLTYGLEKDDTATVSLKLNNLSYTFGKETRTETNDAKRAINTSTYADDGTETIGAWTEYNFYVKTEADVTPTAVLTLSLGFDDEESFIKGYAFFDNFTVNEITEEEFIERKPVEGETEETIDESLIADELVPNNYRIVFTQENADAEEEPAPSEETPEENPANQYLWLWISTGVIGALLIIAVVVVLYKKFSKKSKKLVKGGNKKQVSAQTKNKKDKYSK